MFRFGPGATHSKVWWDVPVHVKSANAIVAEETFTAFVISVVAGALRFAHSSMLQADRTLQAIVGMKRFPTDGTIRNLFKRFTQGMVVRIYEPLSAWQLDRLSLRSDAYILGLDATVFERYGRQGGAKWLQPEETLTSLASSAAGGVGRIELCCARLAAKPEHVCLDRGGGVSERGLG